MAKSTSKQSGKTRVGKGKRRAEVKPENSPIGVVGLGASAGGIAVLQEFFEGMPPNTGLAFVVVMHLAPEHESNLPAILQHTTAMPVVQVHDQEKVQPDHVYVIPPNKHLTMAESSLRLRERQQPPGRRVAIDLFFRTLAQAYGQRAVCIVLSGSDSDGAIGLKHIKAQGGVTIAQDPNEAEHNSMPRMAIDTGMVDWVLPVREMPKKLVEFVRNEERMRLPPERSDDEPDQDLEKTPGGRIVARRTHDPEDESALQEVLRHLHSQTGHNFGHYKRATVLRRIARRLQVNSIENIPTYLEFLRTHFGEAEALLQDLLIGVTNFFRDRDAFAALEANVPQLFTGKTPNDQVRVWVPACATGEEAYSIAMMLCEQAAKLDNPPGVQVFATDIDDESIAHAREGLYPTAIEVDVSQQRLRQFFNRDHGRYRVKKEIREKILFASHNLLKDPPFSRLDLISCRNLLIYLKRTTQVRVLDIFHFALRSTGLLFVGGSETVDDAPLLFAPLERHHRIYVRRTAPRSATTLPSLGLSPRARTVREPIIARPPIPPHPAVPGTEELLLPELLERRALLFGEVHLKLLEKYGPPSVVINQSYDVVHLSATAGRYLRFGGGEPSANLFSLVHPALRLELRTAIFRARQDGEKISIQNIEVPIDGQAELLEVHVQPVGEKDPVHGFTLIVFEKKSGAPAEATRRAAPDEPLAQHLEEELDNVRKQLDTTVEQYEASNQELKASNEELQAMNEEVRSTAEELETSQEELQSINEELSTVNHELKTNVEQLSRANSDLQNLMAATDIGTIFLNHELRLDRFTPPIQEIFNLRASDLGRPLSDITHQLDYPTMGADAEQVMEQLTPITSEVRGEGDSWFLTRIKPYRTSENKIDGVVITFVDISARKQMEEELRESAERLKRAFRVEKLGVLFFHIGGPITDANDAFLRMSGYTRADLKNGLVSWSVITPPEWMARLERTFAELKRDGHSAAYEKEYARKDGSRWWGLAASTRIAENEGVKYILDITDRKEAAAALTESEERFRLLVEGTPEYAMFLLDPGNQIIYWSLGAERIFGWTADEALGKNGRLIFTPEDRARKQEEKELRGALRKGFANDCRWHLRKDGSRVWVDGVMRRLDDEQGHLRGFAKIARDATEQRLAEEKMEKANADLEQRVKERTADLTASNRKLKEENAQRIQLEQEVLLVSEREKRRIGQDLHDSLCQELAAAAFFLQSASHKVQRKSPEEAKILCEAANIVNQNVGLARDLARGLHPVELSANGLANALRELAYRCNQGETKCVFDYPAPVRVRDDAIALNLYRIAQEAVNNAIKNGKAKKIVISLAREVAKLCLSVEDDGRGFSPERPTKGMGIHIMKYRADIIGATLELKSGVGHGTRISCKLSTRK